jgi:hypothetical protein
VVREELVRLFTWEERHRRLAARLIIALVLTLLVLAAGSVVIWVFESGPFGDAVFFTAVQLLTVSSSLTNPLTAVGKLVDVALEGWGIFVVTAVAGSFASFSVQATPANQHRSSCSPERDQPAAGPGRVSGRAGGRTWPTIMALPASPQLKTPGRLVAPTGCHKSP